MRSKLQEIGLALLLLAASIGAGQAQIAERPAPTGGVLSLLSAWVMSPPKSSTSPTHFSREAA